MFSHRLSRLARKKRILFSHIPSPENISNAVESAVGKTRQRLLATHRLATACLLPQLLPFTIHIQHSTLNSNSSYLTHTSPFTNTARLRQPLLQPAPNTMSMTKQVQPENMDCAPFQPAPRDIVLEDQALQRMFQEYMYDFMDSTHVATAHILWHQKHGMLAVQLCAPHQSSHSPHCEHALQTSLAPGAGHHAISMAMSTAPSSVAGSHHHLCTRSVTTDAWLSVIGLLHKPHLSPTPPADIDILLCFVCVASQSLPLRQ